MSCWHWASIWAGLSSACLRMVAALTGDRAVLILLLHATSLPCTVAAAASDLAARAARMQRFQAMPLFWCPVVGFVPLFVFWAAEDPLSTSGY